MSPYVDLCMNRIYKAFKFPHIRSVHAPHTCKLRVLRIQTKGFINTAVIMSIQWIAKYLNVVMYMKYLKKQGFVYIGETDK